MQNGKIKILHAIGVMDYGGAETMIMNLYRKLDRETFQFDFLVHRDKTGQYDSEILELGGKIYYIPEFKIYNTVKYRKVCRAFFQKHSEYDIVHGHIESCAAIYLSEAKRAGMYTIAHCHSTGFEKLLPKILYNLLTFRTRKIADYFFACSQQAGYIRFGCRVIQSDRFLVFNNGIDASKYSYSLARQQKLKQEWNLEHKFVIGHVGRMAKEKNHLFLLQVFASICQYKKDAVLVLVGDGPERRNIEEQSNKFGISDKVIFAGSRSDIPDVMNLFDVFVFPSVYEGLGIALIEAQAAGLPCVVSDAIVKEAVITPSVRKLSLELSSEKWAVEVLEISETARRTDNYGVVCRHGFDIYDTTKRLEQFYREHYRKED